MKHQIVLPACLLLWTLTVSRAAPEIYVTTVSGGYKISCSDGYEVVTAQGNDVTFPLQYKDENSGEYKCEHEKRIDDKVTKVFVKFRTCENCVELDPASMTGLAVGNLVAFIVIGVSVYLVARQDRISEIISEKKSSDRKRLVPNEVSNAAPNDQYQELVKKKRGPRSR